MGLSASQGRLLLLTARQSDLEFRAQQISQRRLILSSQLEEIAREYQDATSNRQMKISLYSTTADENQKSTTTKNLSYATLVSGTRNSYAAEYTDLNQLIGDDKSEYQTTGNYRLSDGSNIIVANESEIPSGFTKSNDGIYTVNGKTYKVDSMLGTNASEPNYLQDCIRNGKYLIQQGKVESGTKTVDGKLNNNNVTYSVYNYNGEEIYKIGDTWYSDTNGTVLNNVDDTKATVVNETKRINWTDVSWDSLSCISDSYYTDDDAAAEAKYDREQTLIQNQDKKLEQELNDVETQRTAVKTEIDSVNKVIENNIEKSFNIFS